RAREPFHPLPGRRPRHHNAVVEHVGQRQRPGPEVVDRERRHLGLGERASHRVGIHPGLAEQGGGHEWLDGVAAADLDRHHGPERAAEILLHHRDGAGDGLRVGEPLLSDEGRTHVRHDRDEIVVGEIVRIEQVDDGAGTVQLPHVEEAVIGTAAAARAEDPGADRERFDLGRGHGTARHEAAAYHGGRLTGWRATDPEAFNVHALGLYTSLGFEVKAPLARIVGHPGPVPPGVAVRTICREDVDECDRLYVRVQGWSRRVDPRDALGDFTGYAALRDGRIVACTYVLYAGVVAWAVAETDDDMMALLAGVRAAVRGPVGVNAPTG